MSVTTGVRGDDGDNDDRRRLLSDMTSTQSNFAGVVKTYIHTKHVHEFHNSDVCEICGRRMDDIMDELNKKKDSDD